MLNNTTSASKIELIRHASEIQHRMAVFFVVAKFKIKTLAGIYSKYCRVEHRPTSLTCLAALPATGLEPGEVSRAAWAGQ